MLPLNSSPPRQRPKRSPPPRLKNELNINGIPNRRPIHPHPRPEPQRQQHFFEPPIVPPVTRGIESNKGGFPFLIDIEVRGEVVPSQRRGRRKRRQKELSWTRRITLTRATTGAGAVSRAGPRSNARSDATSTSRSCAGAAACTGARPRIAGTRRIGLGWLRRGRRSDGRCCRHSYEALRRLDRRFDRRDQRRGVGGRWPETNETQPFGCTSRCAPRSSSTTASGTRPASAHCGLRLEPGAGDWKKNQQNDQRMGKKRGGDTLPPPLFSFDWYADRRPVPVTYAPAGSFGDTPITFTPAPRATSIA